jgi:3-carboxy-cis,cis-muconate cycloisomerase
LVVSDAMAAVTADEAWLQAMLDAEAALAWAEEAAGVVPAGTAGRIAAACRAERFDPAELGRQARAGGNPVIPLVAALTRAVGGDAGGWVHWGATSQDILDTAQMLVSVRALSVIDRALTDLAAACAAQAEAHRRTLMAGRTLLQQALPVTFGLCAAGWLTGVVGARAGLRAAGSALPAQLGGAAGTLASLGDHGPAVVAAFADHLGLAEPVLPWHTARQPVAALAAALGVVAGTAAKVSGDVALLMQTELAEVSEPAEPGRGGSSTLPHKRNPVAAAAVGSAARQATALVPVLLGALVAEHQRPVGAWQAEWEPLSRLLALAGSAGEQTAMTVAGLEVHVGAMRANLDRTGGLLLAERVTLALAVRTDDGTPVGRPAARSAVEHACRSALASGRDLADALADDPLAGRLLPAAQIRELLDPVGYLGSTDVWIDRALAAHAASDGVAPGLAIADPPAAVAVAGAQA